ncbi:hypothetical protein BHM03_00061270 [Ensete ventricosum]|nr:hypothetical protein BHM03_00061270 [Ensete ventricosum]
MAYGVTASSSFNSSSFPAGFVFGAASAAYQVILILWHLFFGACLPQTGPATYVVPVAPPTSPTADPLPFFFVSSSLCHNRRCRWLQPQQQLLPLHPPLLLLVPFVATTQHFRVNLASKISLVALLLWPALR